MDKFIFENIEGSVITLKRQVRALEAQSFLKKHIKAKKWPKKSKFIIACGLHHEEKFGKVYIHKKDSGLVSDYERVLEWLRKNLSKEISDSEYQLKG